MPDETATASLAAELRSIQGRPLFDELASIQEERRPVVAMVGPSGTGKSTLLNAVAGIPVSEAGVLRPTTRQSVDWRDPEADVRLVDFPPSDHDRAGTVDALAKADVAVVVTSQARYADAETWGVVEAAEEAGIPIVLVVNRVDALDDQTVRSEMEGGGRRVITVAEGDLEKGAASIRGMVVLVGAHADEIRAYRRGLAAGRVTEAVALLADELRVEATERAALRVILDEAFRTAKTELGLGEAASMEFEDATRAVQQLIETNAAGAEAMVIDAWRDAGRDLPAALVDARLTDAEEIDRWRARTADAAVEAIRPRILRRLGARRIADEAWRLAADPARHPSSPTRALIGRRLAELRSRAGTELDDVIATRIEARAEPYRSALRVPDEPNPDRLVELAERLPDEHPEHEAPGFLSGDGP